MLFSNAFKSSLLSRTNNFTRLAVRRGAPKRGKADATAAESSSASGEEGLLAAVGVTFGTYMIADFLSNFIQHPTQQMDYGYFNQFIGREVDQSFWGTRTEHIVGVAGCLAITDHASQKMFARRLGQDLCFAKNPAAFIAHTFLFIFTGVSMYCVGDAALNPAHEGRRMEELKAGVYCSYVGTNTAWFEPYVPVAVAKFAGQAAAGTWLGSSLLPATLAYSTVKGVGWTDWGNSGLNDHEMKLNGLKKVD